MTVPEMSLTCDAAPSIASSSPPWNGDYVAENALQDLKCDGEFESGGSRMNFWLSRDYVSGQDAASFVIDLGCRKKIAGIRVRNTQNRNIKDRYHIYTVN